MESKEHVLKMAAAIKEMKESQSLPLVIFKSSFDKANRTSASGHRGPGLETGLEWLKAAKEETGLPVMTDVHDVSQCAALAEVVDVIQIPAFLCRQTDLLVAAGKTGRVIHIKKGQFASAEIMKHAVEKVRTLGGNHRVIVSERGVTFGYSDLVVDYRNLPKMRALCNGALVALDATHSVQQPGGGADGGSSAGLPHMIPTIARAGVAVGVDGLFFETHDEPSKALCDGTNQIPLARLPSLIAELKAIADASKWREDP